jgi:hypothetical protein
VRRHADVLVSGCPRPPAICVAAELESAKTSRGSVIIPVARVQLPLRRLLYTVLEAGSLQKIHAAVEIRGNRSGCYHLAVLPGWIPGTPTLKYRDRESMRI